MADSTTPRGESLIDRESHFTGTYRTPHDLRIEGRYEGEIECKGTVHVGETAVVNARIVAGNVTVAGQCDGEVACDNRFEILRTGRVSGTVTSASTVVHEGAFYQGDLRMSRGPADRMRREPAAPPAMRQELPARPPAVPEPARSAGPAPAPAPPSPAAAERPAPPAAPRRRGPEQAASEEAADAEMPASLIPATATSQGYANGSGNGRGSSAR